MNYKMMRNPSGQALSIVTERLLRRQIVTLSVLFLTSIIFIYAGYRSPHSSLMKLAAVFTVTFLFILVHVIRQGGKPLVIADENGIRFPQYSTLGIVPWEDIETLGVQVSLTPSLGLPVQLVANLRDPETYKSKLSCDNAMRPGKPLAPAFAMITSSTSPDEIQKLIAQLNELGHRHGHLNH